MADATNTAASKLPHAKFAIIDYSAAALKDKPKNVEGLLFKEQEAGYLAGYLAGLWAKDNNAKVVSTVGGQKIPPVDHYIAGYQAGAKKAYPGDPDAQWLLPGLRRPGQVQGDRPRPDRQGLEGRLPVAGGCGLGALDAAKEKGVQGIGVDADQSYLGDYILTSATKHVDLAVYNAIKSVQDGTFKGGTDVINTVANNGVGLGKIGPAGQQYADQVKKIRQQIAAGEIKDIPDTVK